MWTPINRDWTTKPPLGTPLRTDGHWSVQGLVGCWLFNEGAGIVAFDLSGNSPLANNGLTWICEGIRNSTSGQYANSVASTKSQVGSHTLVIAVKLLSGDTQTLWTDSCITLKRVYGATPNTLQYIVNTAASDWTLTAGTLSIGTNYTIFASWDKTGKQRVIYNGVSYSNDAINLNPNYTAPTSVEILRATASGNTAQIGFGLLYNRVLSPNEIASLSANPYQVCQP